MLTRQSLKRKTSLTHLQMILPTLYLLRLVIFISPPMEVIHDKTVVCFAFVIKHKDLGSLLFITDSLYFPTKYDKFITGCTTVMIEANYSDELIDQNVISGKIHETQRQRVMFTHMEICNTIQVVKRSYFKEPYQKHYSVTSK